MLPRADPRTGTWALTGLPCPVRLTAMSDLRTPSTDQPRPEPIRFYGTTWLDHSGGYGLRRFGLGLGAMLLAALSVLLLRLGYAGLQLSDTAGWLRMLVVVAFGLCSAMAFSRTLSSYTQPSGRSLGDDASFRSIKVIGFIGVLLAYALRSAVEAPGEKLLRRDHEAAVRQYEQLHAKRSGHPARRRKRKNR